MSTRQMTTAVTRPGTRVEHQTLRDVMPATPEETDRAAYRQAVEDLEKAERSADEQSRAIRIH